MGDPTVSVIIPCFNYGRFVEEAVSSALNQSVPPLEVVVVDDGSTDGSGDAALAAGARVIRQRNQGFAAARNRGVKEARGDLIAFLDADDRYDPRFLEICLRAYQRGTGKRFVYTQWRTFGVGDSTVSHWPAYSIDRLIESNFIPISILIPRAGSLEHPFRTSMRQAYEDWDFQLRLAEAGYRGLLVDEPLLHYRQHPDSAIVGFHEDELVVRRTILAIALRHSRLFGHQRILALSGAYLGAVKGRLAARLHRT